MQDDLACPQRSIAPALSSIAPALSSIAPAQNHFARGVGGGAGAILSDVVRAVEVLPTVEGKRLAVASVEALPGVHRVYNLEVEQEHHYYAGQAGVLVHNAYGGVNAPKTVAEMSAAERRAHYIAKGVPEGQFGPSGYPKVHIVEKPTLKQAEEAARNAGGSAPIKHTQDAGQPTHFHAVDEAGNKLTGPKNVHYQKRGG